MTPAKLKKASTGSKATYFASKTSKGVRSARLRYVWGTTPTVRQDFEGKPRPPRRFLRSHSLSPRLGDLNEKAGGMKSPLHSPARISELGDCVMDDQTNLLRFSDPSRHLQSSATALCELLQARPRSDRSMPDRWTVPGRFAKIGAILRERLRSALLILPRFYRSS
jgi:hypothetical protein